MATVFTIGHSSRTLDELIEMLKAHGAVGVADVRRFAGSRRLPHFNSEALARELPQQGIAYHPCPLLGGRRKARVDSVNTGWRNESFRAYADYMQTPPFLEGLSLLMEEARQAPLAMMCAEAGPWRCHRSLIADALIVRGWTVLDIMSRTKATPHQLTPFARLDGTALTYPDPPGDKASVPKPGEQRGPSQDVRTSGQARVQPRDRGCHGAAVSARANAAHATAPQVQRTGGKGSPVNENGSRSTGDHEPH